MRAAAVVIVIALAAVGCNAKGEAGVAAMEKWSKTICACKDLACAQQQTLAMKKELDQIEAGSRGKISDSQMKRIVELGNQVAGCIEALKAGAAKP